MPLPLPFSVKKGPSTMKGRACLWLFRVSREEKEQWINGLARIYQLQGLQIATANPDGRPTNEIKQKGFQGGSKLDSPKKGRTTPLGYRHLAVTEFSTWRDMMQIFSSCCSKIPRCGYSRPQTLDAHIKRPSVNALKFVVFSRKSYDTLGNGAKDLPLTWGEGWIQPTCRQKLGCAQPTFELHAVYLVWMVLLVSSPNVAS